MLENPKSRIEELVLEEVSKVEDPEIGLSLTELGLIYTIDVQAHLAKIQMTYTSMACPAGPQMKEDVKNHALRVEGIEEVEVEIVWTPRWDPKIMATDEAKMHLGILDE